jgi:acyl carrier protein
MENRIKNVMAAVFNYPNEQIQDDTSSDSIDKWDSVGHMNLIVGLEEEFGIIIEDDEISEMLNFALIKEILKSKI